MDISEPLIVATFQRSNAPSIELQATLLGKNRKAAVKALIDSGATGNILNKTFAERHRMKQIPLDRPKPLINADGSKGQVLSYINLDLEIRDTQERTHKESIRFYIANIGKQDAILGTDWLIKHNPEIDWSNYQVNMTRCPSTCEVQTNFNVKSVHKEPEFFQYNRPSKRQRTKIDKQQKLWTEDDVKGIHNRLHHWEESGHKHFKIMRMEVEDSQGDKEHSVKYSNLSQKLAQKHIKPDRTEEDIVPKKYHEYLDVFSKKKSE